MPDTETIHDPSWLVVLDDTTVIEIGEGVLFQDLPFDRVRSMAITFGAHRHVVDLSNGWRPVYFSKVQIRMNPMTEDQSSRRIVCVGRQQTVKGVNVKALVWLDADGLVVHCDDDPGEW